MMSLWQTFAIHFIFVSIFALILGQSPDDNLLESDLITNEVINGSEKHNYWGSEGPSNEFCYSRECTKIGKEFRLLINRSVDPCDDFYEFVCGKYSRNMEIPVDAVSVGTFQTADDKIQNILRDQLSQPNPNREAFSVKYATDMYNACNDFNTTESRGVQPLLNSLAQIGGWPLIKNVIPFDETNYDIFEALAKFIAIYGESAIIAISVSVDLKNSSRNALYLGPSTQLHFGANLLEEIQNQTRGIPVPTSPPVMPNKLKKRENLKKETLIEFMIKFILQMVELMGGSVDNQAVQQVIDILVFSSNLAQLQTQGQDLESQYNRMTIKQLEELTAGKINWLKLLNRVNELSGSRHRFTPNDYCIVTDVNYFKLLPDVLSQTPKTVFANFLGQILVNDLGVYTIEAFRKLNFELLRAFYHVEEQEPLWQFCLSFVRSSMGFAISRKYVEQNFSERTKLMVTELVGYIKSAFYALIERNPILDDYSRRRSLTKLRAIKENIGYPDWIFSNSILDRLYALRQRCERELLFECVTHLLSRLQYRMFESIEEPVDRNISSFPFDPTIINAAYFPLQNSITIPVAIINTLFSCENPRQLNYAQLGFIIGHEFTHGFDTLGSQFDERGNLNDIFDTQTQTNFNNKEKCFVNQYNNYCDSGRCVNGLNSLGENTADNGGMRETFKAYQMCNQNNGMSFRLPFVSQYTTDQLFFISYATLWCENVRPEYLPVVYNDVHSPGKFRVNGVLSNFQPFADSFRCTKNSTMNARNKCILW